MWPMLIFAALLAITGVYKIADVSVASGVRDARAAMLADTMVTYRTAVTRYVTTYGTDSQHVGIAALKAANLLPGWSILDQQPETSIWSNHISPDGKIYIYATSAPPPEVVSHLLRLSHNSVLVGVFRSGDVILHSPVFGNTNIPLPAPAITQIPNGSPVWVAMRD